MIALKLSIVAGELGRRMRDRLRGAATTARVVVWQQAGQRLLIYPDTLNTRFLDGWLVCNLDVETDQTRVQTLQFVFFLGKELESDGQQAAATINAPTVEAAQVAAAWGPELSRVLWDAVLDVIEASVHHASTQQRGLPVTLQGFHCTSDAVHVHVLVGDV